jgi:hypothetical protein
MKHNKKRNTAFIYEILTRELTKAIVNKTSDRKKAILSILKENLGRGTVLGEELVLYRTLLETSNVQQKVAERLLTEAKGAHASLDETTIFDAQSRLIAAINKGLGQDVWSNFVPNFKSLASVNGIFNSKMGVKKRVLFEQAIIDKMSHAHTEAQPIMQPVDNLTYHSFIKKFNDKYATLLQEQQNLLSHYVTSFADDGLELRVYLNEEISRLKNILSESLEKDNTEKAITQKVSAVYEYLEGFRKREFGEKDLGKVLKVQALTEELAAHD